MGRRSSWYTGHRGMKGNIQKTDENNENTRHVAGRGAKTYKISETNGDVWHASAAGGEEAIVLALLVAHRGARVVAASPNFPHLVKDGLDGSQMVLNSHFADVASELILIVIPMVAGGQVTSQLGGAQLLEGHKGNNILALP
ncbi:hypothetical protein BJV78DRAFT_1354990 [Lactifluus subvellereus]|nr:hypothetical protein BJV78DRAFT_1354990 [Lactifluus subvellereus]